MTRTITLKALPASLSKVITRINSGAARYVVTNQGKPVVVMLGHGEYESLIETMEILSDHKAMERIRKSMEDIKKGRTIPLEEVKGRLARV
jgi:prevent-host-death family protein